jgi:hypothetical protein
VTVNFEAGSYPTAVNDHVFKPGSNPDHPLEVMYPARDD